MISIERIRCAFEVDLASGATEIVLIPSGRPEIITEPSAVAPGATGHLNNNADSVNPYIFQKVSSIRRYRARFCKAASALVKSTWPTTNLLVLV